MNPEIYPDTPEADEGYLKEIKALLAEGWKFQGNVFEQDQTYRLVVSKEGEEDRIFHTNKPYPEMFDSTGRAK